MVFVDSEIFIRFFNWCRYCLSISAILENFALTGSTVIISNGGIS